MLGKLYLSNFEIGEYVEWRRICRDENYEESVSLYQGLIVDLLPVDMGGRTVWYAKVLENGGKEELILMSKIRKVETN
tara:strand:+ start:339 stop:572 length:234 start_codon:yes stop_codon:yes gene_type:complete